MSNKLNVFNSVYVQLGMRLTLFFHTFLDDALSADSDDESLSSSSEGSSSSTSSSSSSSEDEEEGERPESEGPDTMDESTMDSTTGREDENNTDAGPKAEVKTG